MIPLAKPTISAQEIQAVTKVLRSGHFVQGKEVTAFEKELARYLRARYAAAVNSGTSALHVALLALGVGKGDEVLVPAFTWPSVANVVELTGAKTVPVDIETSSFNIDPRQMAKKITKRTRAVIVVHAFGLAADMDAILTIARRHKLKVIEDAACALGTKYKRKFCGTIGDIGCYSFHPRKIITTGEGGVLVTRDTALAEKIKSLRNHGITIKKAKPDFSFPGYNYRMTEFQAALGLVQLKKLNAVIRARIAAAGEYKKLLKTSGAFLLPPDAAGQNHIYQSYVVCLQKGTPAALIRSLKKKGIEATIGTYAIHRASYYKKKYKLAAKQFPGAEEAFQKAVSLPVYFGMRRAEVKKVARALLAFVEGRGERVEDRGWKMEDRR